MRSRLSHIAWSIATNQSGVSRGYFTAKTADEINTKLIEMLAREAVHSEWSSLVSHVRR